MSHSPLKYLVAVDAYFFDSPGGAARVAWDMALIAKNAGHQVAIVCLQAQGKAETLEQKEGIDILRIKTPSLPFWDPRRIYKTIQYIRTMVIEKLGDDWDILHIHSLRTGLGAYLALARQTKTIYTMHSPVQLEYATNNPGKNLVEKIKNTVGVPLLGWFEGYLLQQSLRIHVLSLYTKEYILHNYPQHFVKTQIIPYWKRRELQRTLTKQQAREALRWPKDTPILFTVRTHGPRTGIADAIEAIAPFAREGKCYFYIGGDGPLRPMHEEMVRTMGITKHVHILGRVSDEVLAQAYQAADLFLLPTRALECFGLISIESMAMGCPVLSSDSSAIPEVVRPILPDFLYPAGDVEALQKKIQQFLQGTLLAPPAETLLAYVNDHYSEEVLHPTFLDLLRSL